MRLTRLAALAVLALALLAAPLAAEAQPAGKVWRIGLLTAGGRSTEQSASFEAFRYGLSERGYVEGRNLAIEYRYAEGDLDRLPALAAELLAKKVDVVVTVSTPAALAAKSATSTIPIVMATAGDPVGTGLVSSLSRPGANITGLSLLSTDITAKRLELTDLCTLGLRPAPRAPGLSTSEVDIHVQGTPPVPHPSDRGARRERLCHFRTVGGVAAALDPLRLERAPRLLDAASGC
jgi:ABC-type uncharacterized transport system substrate-binding protein